MLRRLIVVLAIVSAVAVGFAQVPANPASKPDQTKRPPGSCNFSGRVVSAAEGGPLRSARVALVEANQRTHPLVYATTTDDEGHFEIKQIEAGVMSFSRPIPDISSSSISPKAPLKAKGPCCR